MHLYDYIRDALSSLRVSTSSSIYLWYILDAVVAPSKVSQSIKKEAASTVVKYQWASSYKKEQTVRL